MPAAPAHLASLVEVRPCVAHLMRLASEAGVDLPGARPIYESNVIRAQEDCIARLDPRKGHLLEILCSDAVEKAAERFNDRPHRIFHLSPALATASSRRLRRRTLRFPEPPSQSNCNVTFRTDATIYPRTLKFNHIANVITSASKIYGTELCHLSGFGRWTSGPPSRSSPKPTSQPRASDWEPVSPLSLFVAACATALLISMVRMPSAAPPARHPWA